MLKGPQFLPPKKEEMKKRKRKTFAPFYFWKKTLFFKPTKPFLFEKWPPMSVTENPTWPSRRKAPSPVLEIFGRWSFSFFRHWREKSMVLTALPQVWDSTCHLGERGISQSQWRPYLFSMGLTTWLGQLKVIQISSLLHLKREQGIQSFLSESRSKILLIMRSVLWNQ